MGIKLIPNQPALLIESATGRSIVIADLHFGSPIFSDVTTLISFINEDCERMVNLCSKNNCIELIIAGDVKETIGKPSRSVSNAIQTCFENIANRGINISIILGNHDGNLGSIITNGVTYHRDSIEKIINQREKLIITHGHKKLMLDKLMNAKAVISGHIHPGYKIDAKYASVTVKAWVVVDLIINGVRINWIILPSFSSLINGIAVNDLSDSELLTMSPFPNTDKLEIIDRRYFLLDLTPMF